MILRQTTFLIGLISCLFLFSCSKPPAPIPEISTLSAAQRYFLQICHDELKQDVVLIPKGKTLWVYVPLEINFFDVKATQKNQTPSAPTLKSWSIQFLESSFEDKSFLVKFDFAITKKYDQKNTTYQNKYSDKYSEIQRGILTALTRAYFDVGQKNIDAPILVGNKKDPKTNDELAERMTRNPLTSSEGETPPEFFVMVFADIKNGVAIKSISYFNDMKMALSNPPALTNEEYAQRYVYDIYGDENLIGDKTGGRLKTEDIQLGDFLAKQIENRVKFQFTQSGFPPTGEVQDEIWTIIAQVCRLYNFTDFEKIKLIDLRTETESTFNKSQL